MIVDGMLTVNASINLRGEGINDVGPIIGATDINASGTHCVIWVDSFQVSTLNLYSLCHK